MICSNKFSLLLLLSFISSLFCRSNQDDAKKASILSCRSYFEDEIEKMIRNNYSYDDLINKTGLKSAHGANKGLMLVIAEVYKNQNQNPYQTEAEATKLKKTQFDEVRKSYNTLLFSVEQFANNTKDMNDINFWVTFFRTKSLVMFKDVKSSKLKQLYEETFSKIEELRKNKKNIR